MDNSSEALSILGTPSMNVVWLDCDDGTQAPNEFILPARRRAYLGHFLVIAGASDPGDAPEAVEPGASGIFLKSEALERPVQAIILVADGAVWLDQRIPRRLANQSERLVRLEDRSSSDHTWPSRSKNGL